VWNGCGEAFYTRRTEPTVTTSPSALVGACSQCERPLPVDSAAVEQWRHGSLFLAGELDATAALLLCPDCVEDEHSRAFDEGGQE
jgi:hypothetical protein